MDHVRDGLADKRAHTDASLDAERAGTDQSAMRTVARAQRLLDDRIDRDRILADERLSKFRDRADQTLTLRRDASPAPHSSLHIERHVADVERQAERDVVDALLERERRRSDTNVDAERKEHEVDRAHLAARRQATDDQLGAERSGADVAVTALDATENALAVARDEQARRWDVLAMVTHDLRSPLTVIAMNAQIIVEDTKEDSTREAAEDMTCAAARMERLLTDLLDVVRIESKTLRIVKRPEDVGVLVNEVLNSYLPLFEERGLSFRVEAPPQGSLVALLDHDRIVQVLSNLLGNALKFTPREGRVVLQVARTGEQVEFVLHDTGPGIPAAALPRLFERFSQIDSDVRRGLGLGLYICEKIVSGHGGRIWAESDTGEGTTLRFTLPLT